MKTWELDAIETLKGILGRLNTEDLSNSRRIEQLKYNISMLQSKQSKQSITN